MKNIPDKIYLQIGEGIECDDFNELIKSEGENVNHSVTWDTERIFDTDLEYKLMKSKIPCRVIKDVRRKICRPLILKEINNDKRR